MADYTSPAAGYDTVLLKGPGYYDAEGQYIPFSETMSKVGSAELQDYIRQGFTPTAYYKSTEGFTEGMTPEGQLFQRTNPGSGLSGLISGIQTLATSPQALMAAGVFGAPFLAEALGGAGAGAGLDAFGMETLAPELAYTGGAGAVATPVALSNVTGTALPALSGEGLLSSSLASLTPEELAMWGESVGTNAGAATAAGVGLTVDEIAGLDAALKDVATSSLTSSDVAALNALAEAAGITGIDASTVLPLDTMIGGQTLGNLLALGGGAAAGALASSAAGGAAGGAGLSNLLSVAKTVAPLVIGGLVAKSAIPDTQTGTTFPIVPVPADWKAPQAQPQFTPSAPINFGSPELLRGTQWEKYINPSLANVINTINTPAYILPQYQNLPNLNQVIGNLNNVPVSINDIIFGITSGQTNAG